MLLTRTRGGVGGVGSRTGLDGGEASIGFNGGDSQSVSPVRDLESWSGLFGGVGSGVGLVEGGCVNTNWTLGLVLGAALYSELANDLFAPY